MKADHAKGYDYIYMAVRLCDAYVKKSAKELQYDYNRLC